MNTMTQRIAFCPNDNEQKYPKSAHLLSSFSPKQPILGKGFYCSTCQKTVAPVWKRIEVKLMDVSSAISIISMVAPKAYKLLSAHLKEKAKAPEDLELITLALILERLIDLDEDLKEHNEGATNAIADVTRRLEQLRIHRKIGGNGK